MFKIGDRVRYIRQGNSLYGEVGIVTESDLFYLTVEFPSVGLVHCEADSVEVAPLPIGNQSHLVNKCDCGGYKVYGGSSPAMHSPWCSSLL